MRHARVINNKGILDRGPIIPITRQANNQLLNSAQNQGDQLKLKKVRHGLAIIFERSIYSNSNI